MLRLWNLLRAARRVLSG